MGVLVKLIDALLFLLLLVIAFEKPLIEAQACLPGDLYPNILVDLRNWYARESGDYLMTEMPDFYVGDHVPIFAELTGSGRAPDKLLTLYFSFLSLGVLAILRGLLPTSSTKSSASIGKRPASGRKKKV
ncbi:PREDICTED: transmembrane 97 [Prunus dulcis]|uniref:PREDICTED: transmembrane 97 n=1 Tax=Prunus dulcis TaxID=3755 RepID=A0A5E4FXX9_PRUDU|nr:PREDICTED: transmembrane 97 [Prunus dulcis]